jgi:hypothetical protein
VPSRNLLILLIEPDGTRTPDLRIANRNKNGEERLAVTY